MTLLARSDSSARGHQGFTLIEVLIGLTLLAVVLTLVQGVYAGIVRSRDYIQAQTERSHAVALLLHRMADELVSALAAPGDPTRENEGIVLDKDSNLDSTLEFSALLPPVLQDGGKEKGGGIARIRYHLEKAEDGSLDLVRTDSRAAADEAGASPSNQEKQADVLLKGVSRFRVKLLGEGDTWRESSGGTESGGQEVAPRAVSIEIAWKVGKKEDGAERVLRTAVPLYGNLERP